MKRTRLEQIAGLVLMVTIFICADISQSSFAASATDDKGHPGKLKGEEVGTKSTYPIVEGLLARLREKRFAEVQGYFDRLLVEKPYTNSGSRMLEAVYVEMSERRNILGDLQNWCDSKDNGHSAFIMRGRYHIEDAWRARGGGFAYTVTEEGKRLMKDRLLLAKADLEKAFMMNPKDPNSAASMIVVCMGLQLDEGVMEDWFQKAVGADECAFYPYWNKFNYLNPKWHGLNDKFGRFAQTCYTNRPPCGRAYTVIMEYLFERARAARDKKAFWLEPSVQRLSDELINQWLKDFPNSTAARFSQAYIAEDTGREKEAIFYCTEALKIDPYYTNGLSKRGDLNYNIDDYAAAEKDFNQLLKLLPSNDYALGCLGKIQLHHHQNYEKAIAFFDKAVDLEDKTSWYYSERGKAKVQLQRYQAAVADFDQAIGADSQNGSAFYYRGVCLLSLGKQEAGLEDFRKARRLAPELRPRIDGRLLSLDPIRYYNDVLKEEPENVEALLGRAELYLFQKQIGKAKEDLNQAVKIDPNLDKGYYQLAKIAADVDKDFRLAVTQLDKAISINSKELSYYHERGMAKYYLNLYASAVLITSQS